jgi:hypothetical protein
MAATSQHRKALLDAIVAHGRSNPAETQYTCEKHEQQQHGSVIVSIQDAAVASKVDDQPQPDPACLRDISTSTAEGPVPACTNDCSSKAAAAPLPAVPIWASFKNCKDLSSSCKGSIGAKREVPWLAFDSARSLHIGVTQPRSEEFVDQLAALSPQGTPAAQRLLAVGEQQQIHCQALCRQVS